MKTTAENILEQEIRMEYERERLSADVNVRRGAYRTLMVAEQLRDGEISIYDAGRAVWGLWAGQFRAGAAQRKADGRPGDYPDPIRSR